MNRLLSLLAAAFFLHFPNLASATVVSVNQVIDARNIVLNWGIFGPHSPFVLGVGDVLSLHYEFLPGQALEVVNPIALVAGLNTTDGVFHEVTSEGDMRFRGLVGPAHNAISKTSITSGFGLISGFFAEDILDTPPVGTILFTGLDFTISINSFSDGALSRDYFPAIFFVSADRIAAVDIPEPGSVLLVTLALIAAASVGLRRSHSKS